MAYNNVLNGKTIEHEWANGRYVSDILYANRHRWLLLITGCVYFFFNVTIAWMEWEIFVFIICLHNFFFFDRFFAV